MKVPREILDMERPPGTVVVYRKNGMYPVKKRGYTYDDEGKRHVVDGDIVGYFVNGGFVPSNGALPVGASGRIDSKEWGNVAMCDMVFRDVLSDLTAFYSINDAVWLYCMCVIRTCYPDVKDYQIQRRYRESFLSEMYADVPMSRNSICLKLQDVGRESNRIRDFMRSRVGTIAIDEEVVIDGSLQQCESDVNTLSQVSRKTYKTGTRQYLMMYAYGSERHEPICSKVYAGNMTDGRAVADFIRSFGIEHGTIVADKGFRIGTIEAALKDLDGVHYILPLHRDELVITEYGMYDFDSHLKGTSVSCKKAEIPGTGRWLYSFRDPEIAADEERLYLEHHEEGYVPEEFALRKREFGTVVFQSDRDMDCAKVYSMYDDRWLIELMFRTYKVDFDLDDTRVHSDYSVVATNFVNFLSALLTSRLLRAFGAVKELETVPFGYTMDMLRCKRKSRVDGDEWENERYTEKDSDLLARLGLIDRPIVVLEPKKKAGRPKRSKDKKPRKKRSNSPSEATAITQR